MKTAPILFHDIDGVLFGDYAGEFQLRPGSLDRCIRSNPLGQDELLVIQSTLADRLERLRASMGGTADNEEAA